MRLERVRITNFRKIRAAELSDLPAEGLVVVAGPNESGKTSLAESIGFALYGRSVRDNSPVGDLIRWGQDRLEVELHFELTGKRYRIIRQVDRVGAQSATLWDCDGGQVVSGPEAVGRVLRERGLVEFSLFRRLVYVGEAVQDPDLRAELLEEVTGVSLLAGAAASVREELQKCERKYALLAEEIAQKEEQCRRLETICNNRQALWQELAKRREALGEAQRQAKSALSRLRSLRRFSDRWRKRNDRLASQTCSHLEALRSQLEKIENLCAREEQEGIATQEDKEHGAVVRLSGELRSFFEGYERQLRGARGEHSLHQDRAFRLRESEGELRKRFEARRRRTRRVALSAVLGAVVALGGGLYAGSFWNGAFGGIHREDPAVLAAVGFCAVGVFLAIRNSVLLALLLRRTMALRKELRGLGEEIASEDRRAAEIEAFLKEAESPEHWAVVWERMRREGGVRDPTQILGDLRPALARLAKKRREELSRAEAEHREAQEALRKARALHDRLENECREKENASESLKEIKDDITRVQSAQSTLQLELEDNLLAFELLESTVSAVRLRARPALSEALRGLVGPLTGGSFREVRLREDLSAEVFGPLKGDFLSPAELSSAARAGIDLSIVAAMASLLGCGRQPDGGFLLLDYPFSHFDRDRLRQALEAIRVLRGVVQLFAFLGELPEGLQRTQVWTIAEGELRRQSSTPVAEERTEEAASPAPSWPGSDTHSPRAGNRVT